MCCLAICRSFGEPVAQISENPITNLNLAQKKVNRTTITNLNPNHINLENILYPEK
jgi:hypothetical protein